MTPIMTTNPAGGDMPFEEKENLACLITNSRLANGESLEGLTGGLSANFNGYTYYYYLQDAVDFCLKILSI